MGVSVKQKRMLPKNKDKREKHENSALPQNTDSKTLTLLQKTAEISKILHASEPNVKPNTLPSMDSADSFGTKSQIDLNDKTQVENNSVDKVAPPSQVLPDASSGSHSKKTAPVYRPVKSRQTTTQKTNPKNSLIILSLIYL